jgi:hypothetical protein
MRSGEVDRYLTELRKTDARILAFHEPMQKMIFQKP